MNNAFGGADLEILRHALGQFNPNTMDVIEHSIEHRTFNGVLAKEEVARRVLCESRFVAPRQVAGVCSEDGQLALEILRCAMPGCIKGLCRSHAIPHEAVHYCPEHYEIVAFAHDTWKKYDQERAREA